MDKHSRKKKFIGRPVYPGGPRALREFIAGQLTYPAPAREAGIEGTVHLRYDIDHRGAVVDARVIAGLGYGCDEEAIRLVKLLHFEMPASPRGLRVLFHKTISIHFRQPQKAPAPTSQTIQYTITPTPPKAEPDSSEDKETGGGYSYTITW